MAENLNYQTDSSWCYGGDAANCAQYGRLYAWRAARQACPPGWHLPAKKEWNDIIFRASSDGGGDAFSMGGQNSGTLLRAKSGWKHSSDGGSGTDKYGFSALPGGSSKSGEDRFGGAGSVGLWWTSKDENYTSYDANCIYIVYDYSGVHYDNSCSKNSGLSVRCVLGESDLPTEEERRKKHEEERRKKQEMFERWEKEEKERQKKEGARAKNVPAYFTDSRDGRKYRAVTIGGKTWMAENLNYQSDSSRCYNDSDSYCEKYGRLYDWDAAIKVCPAGWHLPSRSEWDRLGQAAGGIVKPDSTWGKHDRNWFISWHEAGLKLKAGSGWKDNGNGTDEYGFSALPGGFRFYINGRLKNVGSYGYWWTATEFDAHNADFQEMKYADGVGYGASDFNNKDFERSVRCVKDGE
jgi:uncharacterized protein (TIGR02145 family)